MAVLSQLAFLDFEIKRNSLKNTSLSSSFWSSTTNQTQCKQCLYLSGHNLLPHGIPEFLVVECSLMQVLLCSYHYSLLHLRVASQEPLIYSRIVHALNEQVIAVWGKIHSLGHSWCCKLYINFITGLIKIIIMH